MRHQERKNSQGWAAFLDSLPQVEELTPLEDTQHPTCQHEMKKIGKRVNSREVDLFHHNFVVLTIVSKLISVKNARIRPAKR